VLIALEGNRLARAIQTANEEMKELTSLPGDRLEGRSGGYFCLATNAGHPLLLMLVGTIPEEKAQKYLSFAQEKARRLGFFKDHSSSWQTRSDVNEMYGGAVRLGTTLAGSFIFSFSGLPEMWDEVLSLAIALRFFSNNDEVAQAALTIAGDHANDGWLEYLGRLSRA
jgi:hypothetical protein